MPRRQASGRESQPESAAKTAGPEGDELLRRRRQHRFSPSGRPRPGTGRHELDRQSARVRQPDVRRCNRVHHTAKRWQPQVPLVDGQATEAARRVRLAFVHPSAAHHNVYRDAPVFSMFLHGDGQDEGEDEGRQGSQPAEEGEATDEDDETTFGLVGPYKVPANWEVVPEETVASSMERGLHLQGFIRGRKVVQLFKHPDGWC